MPLTQLIRSHLQTAQSDHVLHGNRARSWDGGMRKLGSKENQEATLSLAGSGVRTTLSLVPYIVDAQQLR